MSAVFSFASNQSARFAIRIGYVPLIDSAPLLMAKELDLFSKYDVPVRLSREPGWSTVRDKLSFGDLDAAHAPLGLSLALSLGSDCLATQMRAPLMISTHGNAITLSKRIKPEMLGESGKLKSFLLTDDANRRPTFAAVHPWSSHSVMLHGWLARHGLRPGKDVDVLYLPPPVMSRNLKAGTIDGFCVGEPWNSHAIQSNDGWCATRSSTMASGEIEKALIVNETLCQRQSDLVIGVIAALLEACAYCVDPEHDEHIIEVLARTSHLNCSPELLRRSLAKKFDTGTKLVDAESTRPFIAGDVTKPRNDSANWLITGLRAIGTIPDKSRIELSKIFDSSFHSRAKALLVTASEKPLAS